MVGLEESWVALEGFSEEVLFEGYHKGSEAGELWGSRDSIVGGGALSSPGSEVGRHVWDERAHNVRRDRRGGGLCRTAISARKQEKVGASESWMRERTSMSSKE